MKSDRALWIDSQGRLCDAPPAVGSGIKIASIAGVEIPAHVEKEFNLSIKGDRVVQKGKEPVTPKAPAPLIADRDLWLTSEGVLVDKEPEKGINIAGKGEKIPAYYVSEHNLVDSAGKISQKGVAKADTKQAAKPKNKGGSGLKINRGGK